MKLNLAKWWARQVLYQYNLLYKFACTLLATDENCETKWFDVTLSGENKSYSGKFTLRIFCVHKLKVLSPSEARVIQVLNLDCQPCHKAPDSYSFNWGWWVHMMLDLCPTFGLCPVQDVPHQATSRSLSCWLLLWFLNCSWFVRVLRNCLPWETLPEA